MNQWSLWQFDQIVDSFLSGCSLSVEAKLIERLDRQLDIGNMLRFPFTEKVRDGIFELRVDQDGLQPRLLFYYAQPKKIIYVHALFKKTRRIPDQDIELAIQRKKSIESGRVNIHAIGYFH